MPVSIAFFVLVLVCVAAIGIIAATSPDTRPQAVTSSEEDVMSPISSHTTGSEDAVASEQESAADTALIDWRDADGNVGWVLDVDWIAEELWEEQEVHPAIASWWGAMQQAESVDSEEKYAFRIGTVVGVHDGDVTDERYTGYALTGHFFITNGVEESKMVAYTIAPENDPNNAILLRDYTRQRSSVSPYVYTLHFDSLWQLLPVSRAMIIELHPLSGLIVDDAEFVLLGMGLAGDDVVFAEDARVVTASAGDGLSAPVMLREAANGLLVLELPDTSIAWFERVE